MEKELRSSRPSQQQFSIYSNKGGIVIKEELPSEKAFTKIVKEKEISIDEQNKIQRNMSLNFDHSVVDGVIAIEMACAPKPSNLSGPINQNLVSDQGRTDYKPAITAQLQENQIVMNDSPNSKSEEELPLIDGTSFEARTSNISSIGMEGTNKDDCVKIQNPSEEPIDSNNFHGAPGTNNTSEKPESPTVERIIIQNNEEASPKRSFVNSGTNDLGLLGFNNSSVPSTPSSPVPNSGSVSNRSDSTSTSARSFAFPVLQREWNTSPAKLPKADKGRFGKCRGCSALFCCKF